jgi:ribosomal protein S12 methylthiotransferase
MIFGYGAMNQNVYLISLGCPKNLVDSEYLLGLLSDKGMTIVEEPSDAHVILVNTCAFIQRAVEESIDTILQAVQLKESGTVQRVAVFGCLPQRYKKELADALHEVDLIWGSGQLDLMADAIAEGTFPPAVRTPWSSPGFLPRGPISRIRSAPFYSAYLKIAEGCSNHCTYCLIPGLRGPFRSRDPGILLDEAAALGASGAKELILVAQDTTAYGRDLGKGYYLADLLSDLALIPSIEWLRIMYAYPTGLSDPLIEVMAGEPKVLPYLDLPLQHASPKVLRRMGRRDMTGLEKRIEDLRSKVNDLVIRTTMMVGFPGESEDDFNMLMDFCRRTRFDRLGVFKFSPETGIPAADYSDQVPQRIKEIRRRKLMALQRRISQEINRDLKGRTISVLVEGRSPETDLLLVGRTAGQAPQIDGQVLINQGCAMAGEIRPIKITATHDYDLVGETTDEEQTVD